MNALSPREVTVVIRSVGERTEAACRQLAATQVPADAIVTVSNAPFTATLADCYRAGIAAGRPWTLCIDADVLLAPGAISQLLGAAARMDDAVCEVQGLVLDKFFGIRRPAGNHLYRTSLLPMALAMIPGDTAVRPEHHTLSRMAESGHPWVELPVVLGLHDFEQYDRDIFRKCYVHARKFASEMHLLVEFWRSRANDDRDFRVALAGIAAGIVASGDVRVDVRRENGFAEWASREALSEKPPLSAGTPTPAEIGHILSTWTAPLEGLRRHEACYVREIVHGAPSNTEAKPSRRRSRGWLRAIPGVVGRVLGRAGRRLERLAHQPA